MNKYLQTQQFASLYIIIIIIIINEKINVAFSPKTTRTRNIPKKRKNDVFGR